MVEGTKYFIDTNVFLRPLVKDDPIKTKECQVFFEKIEKKEIKAFTSNLVLAEFIWTGQSFYKIKKKELLEALKGILGLQGLQVLDNHNPAIALEIWRKINVKFIDALIASDPRIFKKEVIVVSYDRDFDKIGVLRKEPKEF